jgi:hypothetical protein
MTFDLIGQEQLNKLKSLREESLPEDCFQKPKTTLITISSSDNIFRTITDRKINVARSMMLRGVPGRRLQKSHKNKIITIKKHE